MSLSREVIWEQIPSSDDAETRVQKAFELLLSEEFGLTGKSQLVPAIDQRFSKGYNQANEKAINAKGNRRTIEGIQKVDPQVSVD